MCAATWTNRNRKYSELWCCGRNDHGQLGNGSMSEKSRELPPFVGVEATIKHIPERIAIEWCSFSEILTPIQGGSAGALHSIFLSQDPMPSHVTTVVCFLALYFLCLF